MRRIAQNCLIFLFFHDNMSLVGKYTHFHREIDKERDTIMNENAKENAIQNEEMGVVEKTRKPEKVSIISSMKTKLVVVTIVCIVVTALISFYSTIPRLKDDIMGTTKAYMRDLGKALGEGIDREIAASSKDKALQVDNLDKILKTAKIEGLSSSYTYVVSNDGTMMYHPTPDKIGAVVENDAVKQLLQGLKQGKHPSPDIIEYDFKGVMKQAAYYIADSEDFIIIVTADKEEVIASANEAKNTGILIAVVALLIMVALSTILVISLIKPIVKITTILGKMGSLDFRQDEELEKIATRNDETGVMGRAVANMRNEMVSIIKRISGQSTELFNASQNMNTTANETVQSVGQVERAISEIAEGATSQAQETQSATDNIIIMGNMIQETKDEVLNFRATATEMKQSGVKANQILEQLNDINRQTKSAIADIAQQTEVTNSSALKIKAATNIIADIAEETNLLSLNASIEAARAGEQGRGFAIVASQIQKLAEQSNESARQIEEVTNALIEESDKSVATMEEVKVVIDKQDEYVANTQESFQEVADGIDKSMKVMDLITEKTNRLDEARERVVDTVQNLSAIAEENAASTEETSASAIEVNNTMEGVTEEAVRLNGIANELEDSVKAFTVE